MSPSLNFRRAAYAAETGRGGIVLITITHPALLEIIRVCNNPTQRLATPLTDIVYGTVSRGEQYIYFPMRLKLPSDTDSGPGDVNIEFDNIHRDYVKAIRSISEPLSVALELVLDDDPDTVECAWPEFWLTNVKYNELVITASLNLELLNTEPFPCGMYSPAYFPGLFTWQ
jgi:hypothetical protein